MKKATRLKYTDRMRRWAASRYGATVSEVCKHAAEGCEISRIAITKYVADALESGTITKQQCLFLSKEAKAMSTDSKDIFTGGVNVKSESTKYSATRYEAKHATLGTVINPHTRRPCETASTLDHAKAGVLFKHLALRAGLVNTPLPEHERALLDEMAMTDSWASGGNHDETKIMQGGNGIKALLDDATSGGLEVTPEDFDAAIVTFPLLNGELFPRIDLRETSRRTVEGASIGNPTVTWGTGDNTEIPLFNTTALIAGFDTTIHPATTSVEIGLDFLSDAAVNVGQILSTNIGERMREELDRVIAAGTGSDEPTGIATSSGLTEINSTNGATGPPTLGDYSSLMFAVPKQYRQRSMGCAFLSNDVTFARSRQIGVGTNDARPLLTGGDTTSFNNYSTLGWDHAIQGDLPNGTTIFGCMRKFRMYRRLGASFKFETGGKELSRKNLGLLIMRSRYGGQVIDPDAFGFWDDGQS